MRKSSARKKTWLEKARDTYNWHAAQLKVDPLWKIEDTARELNRSAGGVSEDLLIGSWLKTHEAKLKEFKYAKEALVFIRLKKREMKTMELN